MSSRTGTMTSYVYIILSAGDETTYFIDKIEVELEENIQKYVNELF